MIYYHPSPLDLIDGNLYSPSQTAILPSGAVVNLIRVNDQWQIQSIISTDPADYMNPRMQPGYTLK